jgi:hypothetical protein
LLHCIIFLRHREKRYRRRARSQIFLLPDARALESPSLECPAKCLDQKPIMIVQRLAMSCFIFELWSRAGLAPYQKISSGIARHRRFRVSELRHGRFIMKISILARSFAAALALAAAGSLNAATAFAQSDPVVGERIGNARPNHYDGATLRQVGGWTAEEAAPQAQAGGSRPLYMRAPIVLPRHQGNKH